MRTDQPERDPYWSDEQRWQAVRDRDARADGWFYYSVRTTGVYSRPSCVSRPARRENILFHATPEDAERAGFRACRRCRPLDPAECDPYLDAVATACVRLADETSIPGFEEVAMSVGFSRFHFHRVFKAVTGLTPHSYVAACRAQRLRAELAGAQTVTDAIYSAGFNSSGHFYACVSDILGMTPSAFRAGGDGVELRYWVGDCAPGPVLVAFADRGVCDVLLGARNDTPADLSARLARHFERARLTPLPDDVTEPMRQRIAAATEPAPSATLPADARATILRERIWAATSDTIFAPRLLGTA
ncbi:MAG: Ada metal-binding domain-containing protein [Actinophytocola sp.]|uniref:bifunctional transcriptional activator/DNA repair enzyme AdaA n=1 Tax=Actinophytocola sp. TaxID=1872138 RepID=UPI003C76C882